MTISDVTVTYNNCIGLKKTVESLLRQPVSNDIRLQIIVIDGGSKDGSKEYLEELSIEISNSNIDFSFVSEPDSGIYNAMNKGITLAKGDRIFFLNAGDVLTDDFLISDFFDRAAQEGIYDYDIIYGDCLRDYEGGKTLMKPLDISTIYNGLPFSHQSVFVRTDLFKERKYDESYRISGDYEWFLNAYLSKRTFGYVPLCVSCFDTKGISATNRYENYLEADRIRVRYGVAGGYISRKAKQIVWKAIDLMNISPKVIEGITRKLDLIRTRC